MKLFLQTCFILISFSAFTQSGQLSGRLLNAANGTAVTPAKVNIVELQIFKAVDLEGRFTFEALAPGIYTVKITAPGFQEKVQSEVLVTNARPTDLVLELEEKVQTSKEVKVSAAPFQRKAESPNSLKTLSATEVERLPGANRDVSKVIAALPGVAARATFRNDIIIRGGSPGENKFYLDGIEVPNINHFATQGSSGGPVGLLNVNFIKEVEFYSGAFPANRANGLSSVLAFKQKDGNKDALITNFALGSSDAALTFDGPIGDKGDFIFSVRRSYLQFLFAALKLPILPTYNDYQFKFNFQLNPKNKLSIIGLGALDQFGLNQDVNNGLTDTNQIQYNNFILGNLPMQGQWNYTMGAVWQHSSKSSIQTVVVSRNMLNNEAYRYKNLIEEPQNLLQNYSSFEAENKLRFEHTYLKNGWRFNVGAGYEFAKYYNSTYQLLTIFGQPDTLDFESELNLHKFSAFSQLSRAFLNERLRVSLGLRMDGTSYSAEMRNPFNQFSPMFSASYRLTEDWAINANVARYHQLPSYTILGFRNAAGELVNEQNGLKYIQADHFVLGTEYLLKWNARVTLEGFLKQYSNYPFSIKDSISLANIGSDFGVVGNEAVSSSSSGRSYGAEFLYQQKLYKGFYAVLAYTWVRSEFLDKNNNYVPTSWDSRHIVSLTGGKRFKNGWEFGMRWLFSGGAPYTPYDIATSSLINNWNINGVGLLNYNNLNTQRESSFHQMNIRVDKKLYLKQFNMNFYFDVQNVYGYKAKLAPILLLDTDANGQAVVDPNDPTRYQTKLIENASGILQPTLGIIIEFVTKKSK
jgi:outer membrane receptor for ferrienterochelin and colicin